MDWSWFLFLRVYIKDLFPENLISEEKVKQTHHSLSSAMAFPYMEAVVGTVSVSR